MDLVYAVALLSLAVIFFSVVVLLRDARKPNDSSLALDSLSDDMVAVTCAGLIAFGAGFGTRFALGAAEAAFGLKEIALIATILTACYLTLRTLAARRTLGKHVGVSIHRKISLDELFAVNVAIRSLQVSKNRSEDYPGLSKAA